MNVFYSLVFKLQVLIQKYMKSWSSWVPRTKLSQYCRSCWLTEVTSVQQELSLSLPASAPATVICPSWEDPVFCLSTVLPFDSQYYSLPVLCTTQGYKFLNKAFKIWNLGELCIKVWPLILEGKSRWIINVACYQEDEDGIDFGIKLIFQFA